MMKSGLLLLVFFILGFNSFSQISGCTDPQAYNYNVNATENDGSCQYELTELNPTLILSNMHNIMDETSGLIYFIDDLITHNDSGGEPKLYILDKDNGEIKQTITVSNASNVDWEEIADDENYIYIGDFGNNSGNREDLKIYKISKNNIPTIGDANVNAMIINFSYNDQINLGDSDYDCESFFAYGNYLYLFSKSWQTENTRVYKLPKSEGSYSLDVLDSFNVNGLLTAADINNENNTALLLGYKDYVPFIWILFDFDNDDFFGGNKRRVDFSTIIARQTEAICFDDNGYIYMSSEKTALVQNQLFGLEIEQWISTNTSSNSTVIEGFKKLVVIYDSSSQKIFIKGIGEPYDVKDIQIFDMSGKIRKETQNPVVNQGTTGIFAGQLETGIYFIRIRSNQEVLIGKVIVY